MEKLKAVALGLSPAALMVAYFVLAVVQLFAFAAGIDVWLGWPWWIALVIFIVAQGIPFGALGCVVIAFIGAHSGWGWAWWQALLLVAPFAVVGVLASAAGGIGDLLRRRSPRW